MTTDTASLQERLWEAVAEVRDQHPRVFNDAPTDDVIAAVLPIIAAEVQAASEKAWEEGWEDRNTPDGHAWDGEQDVPLTSSRYDNPYCATEYETGDRA